MLHVPTAPSAAPGADRIVDTYPLAPLQQGMLFHWLRDPHAGVDVEQITATLESLHVHRFREAWEQVTRRHALLRTVFRWRAVDVPMQDVVEDTPLAIHEEDLRGASPDEKRRRLDAFLDADRRTGVRLDAFPVFRLALFRLSERAHAFVWTFPHILLDGRSFALVMREVYEVYDALETGRQPRLTERRPYRDYIDWLAHDDADAARAYWTHALAGFSAPVFPDLGAPVPNAAVSEFAEQGRRLSRDETKTLRTFAAQHGVTVNTMVQGAWALLLARYTGADDVVFGATRAGRRSVLGGDRAVDEMIGFFINTLPVRVRVPPEQPVVDWLRQIRIDQVAVRAVEHTPLALVRAASDVPAGVPLFDTLLVFEREQQATTLDTIDPRWHDFHLHEKTNFPVALHAYDEAELLLRIEYYRSRFDDAAIGRMLGHLVRLLTAIANDATRPIGALPLLAQAERAELLATDVAAPTPMPVGTLAAHVLRVAARQGEATAVEDDGGATLTYDALVARSGTLARRLRAAGVRTGARVGVCVGRTPTLPVSLLAVLRAGAAYVPIDPSYPADRNAYVLSDAGVDAVLTDTGAASALPPVTVPVLRADDASDNASDVATDVVIDDAPDDGERTVYVLYTSGSTGRPKGVAVPHRALLNFLTSMQQRLPFAAADAVVAVTTIGFDIAGLEVWLPLVSGARTVIASRATAGDGKQLAARLARTADDTARHGGRTVLQATPATWRMLLDTGWTGTPSLVALCGGEAWPVSLAGALLERAAHVWNVYGPTETTIWSTALAVTQPGPVTLGTPLANTSLRVLDAARDLAPLGVPGELHIGGAGLALGYHGRPDLTAERFVEHPELGRLYRTGDLVRRRGDRELEYLGRLDFQVKLRGFRIELGEIEAALAAHPAVADAVVVLREDPDIDPRLVAYYVPAPGASVSDDALREALGRVLPEHMVPWVYVPLDAMPLSPSGKLDRRALPAPSRRTSAAERVAPRDGVETRLLRIWTEVLGTADIGVTDRFNAVGGHSLAALRVFGRIQQEFGRELQLVTMLEHDTIGALAALLREPTRADAWSPMVALSTTGGGVPIFCPHAETGYVLIYQHFAEEMAGDHPVYALQAVGNYGTQEPQESIEAMLALYVDEILAVRPHGPYAFLGVSIGGWLALELARAMEARGEEVHLVAMIDTRAPDYPRYTRWGKIAMLTREHGGISLKRVRRIFQGDPKYGRSVRTMYARLKETARWWYNYQHRNWVSWRFEDRNPPQGYAFRTNNTRFRLATRRLIQRFAIRYYPGRLTLFRAHDQPTSGVIPEPTNGWAGRCAELEIHPVSGGHTQAMFRPGVADVAQVCRRILATRASADGERGADVVLPTVDASAAVGAGARRIVSP